MRCFVLCPALSGLLTSWLVFLSTHTVYGDELNGVTLQLTGLGEIRGTLNISAWTNRTIYQFQGIPFAKPPVGNLRFKPPEPAEPWNGTLDATKFGRKCPVIRRSQHEFMKEWDSHAKTENIEDCLNLNVYTPHLQNESLGLPVMVYIHGGSFRVGSAQEFWPNYLLERDVVLVVPQYRLGPLGFLSLQTEDVPGNVGLLDQVLALRWIQKYITQFGGDPGQVTVFGQSAGGAAVTLMQISPLVDKSFFTDIYDMILRHYNLLHDKDYLKHNLTRATLKFSGIEDPTGMVSDLLNEKYFHPDKIGDFKAMTPGLIDICGVALLKAATFRSVLENSRQQPSYLYSFNYYGEHTKFGYGEDTDYPFPGGVAHSDDLIYLFPQPDAVLNKEDRVISRTMVDLWTNFATYTDPAPADYVPSWPPVRTETGPYLRIDRISEVRKNFLEEYTIAMTEGLGPSKAALKRTSILTLFLWFVITLQVQ
ncbi:liver carboxylesterase-like [Zootermopsis nevadensis]|uniref:liver carboxylesterase-like n=1 Tax=Zootermopsis nevadensis TaxID=136037 RepID=UPI000B8E68A0|nr:liver carboxylesterase-like [Zootermopsis nevadensis]